MNDWEIARMKLKFNGIEFPALDLREVELRTLQLDNKTILKVETSSKGIIEMSCAASEAETVADFQKTREHFRFLLEAGNEYRRIHKSN